MSAEEFSGINLDTISEIGLRTVQEAMLQWKSGRRY